MRTIATCALLVLTACDIEYGIVPEVPPAAAGSEEIDAMFGVENPEIPESEEQGGISGRICAPDEATWVAGAEVSVATELGEFRTHTDGEGRFLLQPVPAGQHVLEVAKGSLHSQVDVLVTAGEVTELARDECLPPDLEIAVVTGEYDRVQAVLDRLGLRFTPIPGAEPSTKHIDFLRSPERMAQFDAIFLNCGMYEGWTAFREEIGRNLRDFVASGGSVYASDWSHYAFESAYPKAATFLGGDLLPEDGYVGMSGEVRATVLDPAMVLAVGGDHADIAYDLDAWAAIESAGTAEVLVEGTFRWQGWDSMDSKTHTGPLAVRQHDGEGTIIYTSFHNEQQMNREMTALLQEIILSL